MRMPALLTRKKVGTVAEADAEADRLRQERDAAQAAMAERDAARAAILLDGTADDLREHDEARDRLRLSIEQAEARLARVAAERADAEDAVDQARRKALHRAGLKAAAEVAKLEQSYVSAATAIADTLREIAAKRRAVAEANADLPAGVEPIGEPETMNGWAATAAVMAEGKVRVALDWLGRELNTYDPSDRSIRIVERSTGITTPVSLGSPGAPHQPLADRVRLPGIGRGAPAIW